MMNLRSKKRKIILAVLAILIILIVGGCIAFYLIEEHGKKSLINNDDVEISAPDNLSVDTDDQGFTIEYNGHTYKYNEYITSTLVACVDTFDLGTDVIGTAGQADSIFLLVIDTKLGDCTLISISRDTIAEVDIYNTSGEYVETVNEQLCLAFAYGDGGKSSCENLLTSVSRLFYGIPINSYYVMDFNTIAELTKSVGGVTVTVNEDSFSNYEKGETITLEGNEAVSYLQHRDTSALDSNNARIKRQQDFLDSFMNQTVSSLRNDFGTFFSLYNTITEYSVTNIGLTQVSFLAKAYLQTPSSSFTMKNVPGEVVQGDTYAEYHIDDEAFYQLLLDVYYTQID